MALPALTALRSRSGLRRVLVANALYNFVETAAWIGIIFWAYQVGGAGLAGVAAVVQLVPSALLAPPLGSIGDRISRGTALVLAHGAVAITAATTWAALVADAPDWAVIAASTSVTTMLAVVRPVHYAALPQLARSADELVSANALSAVGEQQARFVGPIVAGVLVELSGPQLVLAIAVVAAAAASLLCVRLRLAAPDQGTEPDGGRLREAFEGLRSLRGDVPSIALLLGMATVFVVIGALDVLGVAFADVVLDRGQAGAGILLSAIGIGGLVGAAVATAFAGGRRLVPVVLVTGGALGSALMLVSIATEMAPAFVMVAAVGLVNSVLLVCGRTLLQRSTDDRILSRVFAVQESTSLLGLAVGSALAPLLIEPFGPGEAFLPLGIGIGLVIVVAALVARPLDARAVYRPRETAMLRGVAFLGALPAYELERLAQRARWRDVDAGTSIVTQGEWGEHFFVIEEGRCSVTVDGALRDHELTSGDSFGEIALLHVVPRTATVTALEPTRLLSVDAADFLAAVTGDADGTALAREVASAHMRRDRG